MTKVHTIKNPKCYHRILQVKIFISLVNMHIFKNLPAKLTKPLKVKQ